MKVLDALNPICHLWRMIPRMIVSLSIAMLLTSCASVGRKIDPAKVEQIHNGSTTNEVVALIGTPDTVTKDGNGNAAWVYMHVQATAKPESFIPVIGMFADGANSQTSILSLLINSSGVVTNLINSTGSMEMGSNLSSSRTPMHPDAGKRPK